MSRLQKVTSPSRFAGNQESTVLEHFDCAETSIQRPQESDPLRRKFDDDFAKVNHYFVLSPRS